MIVITSCSPLILSLSFPPSPWPLVTHWASTFETAFGRQKKKKREASEATRVVGDDDLPLKHDDGGFGGGGTLRRWAEGRAREDGSEAPIGHTRGVKAREREGERALSSF